jgi:hypothetical protein
MPERNMKKPFIVRCLRAVSIVVVAAVFASVLLVVPLR